MQYPTNKPSNKELYTALITALTELTCFGKSELLQQVVNNLKHTDYTKSNQLDHNIFATLFVYLLIKQHPEVMQSILQDPSNSAFSEHLHRVKKWDGDELEAAMKMLEEIKKIDTLRPKGQSGK